MHAKHTTKALALVLSFALATAVPVTAIAVPSSELQAQVDEAYATLTSYANELELANNQLYQLQEDLAATQEEIAQAEEDIAELEAELAEGQENLASHFSDSYKQNSSSSALSVVLGATNFEDLVTRVYYANRINDYESELIDGVKTTKEELEQRREELAEEEAKQQQLVDEQQQKTNEIQAKVSEQQSYYNSLDSELQEQLANEAAIRAAEEAARAEAEAQQQQQQQQQQGQGNQGGTGGSNDHGGSSTGGNDAPEPDHSNTNSGSAPSSVVDVALAQRGKDYQFGATGPNLFDCSGLVCYSYAQMGYSLPHSSQSQYNRVVSLGHLVYSTSYLSPGDLVFWGYGGSGSSIYHVGIYIGGGQYVHASSPGVGVVVSSYYGSNFIGGGSPV